MGFFGDGDGGPRSTSGWYYYCTAILIILAYSPSSRFLADFFK